MSRLRVLILMCAVFEVRGYRYDDCENCYSFRVKRSKNYYGPSQKFYKPPPNIYPIRGPFSYTPPPGYGMPDAGPPPSLRTYKVSKRPTNSGLGEEDLNNIVKYLSKQDLDKIFELARETKGYMSNGDSDNHNLEYDIPDNKFKDSRPMYKDSDDDIPNGKTYEGPYANHYDGPRPKGFQYEDPNPNHFYDNENIGTFQGPPKSDKFYSQAPLDTDESNLRHQISSLDDYIKKVTTEDVASKDDVEINKIQGEWSPQPMNDFEIAFTNKSPKIVKSESSSYKLENFADLPLMDFDDSKLDTVNSYNVPHYTVTSHAQNQHPLQPSNLQSISQVQASAGRDQSDAYLKAVKIWTHKSKGSAYTLHDDGTLSPERPLRPNF